MKTRCLAGFITGLSLAVGLTANAEIPDGYYTSAYNLSTSQLKTAISKIVNPHQQVSSYSALPSYFEETDLYPGTRQWWDMYGSVPIYLPWSGKLLNREHSLPKSWWGGGTTTPAYTDLNHLYPGEAEANQKKSNYPLGEVKSVTWTNGVSTLGVGYNSGGAKYVFEPSDQYKGDFARTYFYMVTSYQDMDWVTTWQVRDGVYPSLQQWAIDLLLKWHREDPVSEKETLRNEAVYGIQNNRNPFIDYPELAEYIWGNRMGEAWNPGSGQPTTNPNLSAPINNMYIDFGQVATGKSVTRQMLVKGSELSKTDLRLLIGGTDRSYFSIPDQPQTSTGATQMTVSSAAASSPSGTWITIVYTPTELGTHEAVGTITGGGLQGSVRFNLRGECLAAPTLSRPTNPRAVEVTDSTYLAEWDPAPDTETVDYWIVTRTIYSGGNVTTREEIAESNQLEVTDFSTADSESFTVRACRLGYESPESDVVYVSRSAIDGIDADEPLTVESFAGSVRIRCSEPLSSLTVYDMTGRTVLTVNGPVYDCFEFSLPAGVYIITAPEHRTPVKVVAK